jgi:hypothetical protein
MTSGIAFDAQFRFATTATTSPTVNGGRLIEALGRLRFAEDGIFGIEISIKIIRLTTSNLLRPRLMISRSNYINTKLPLRHNLRMTAFDK